MEEAYRLDGRGVDVEGKSGRQSKECDAELHVEKTSVE